MTDYKHEPIIYMVDDFDSALLDTDEKKIENVTKSRHNDEIQKQQTPVADPNSKLAHSLVKFN